MEKGGATDGRARKIACASFKATTERLFGWWKDYEAHI